MLPLDFELGVPPSKPYSYWVPPPPSQGDDVSAVLSMWLSDHSGADELLTRLVASYGRRFFDVLCRRGDPDIEALVDSVQVPFRSPEFYVGWAGWRRALELGLELPDSTNQECPLCHRGFDPDALHASWIRSLGPPRYCDNCCWRACWDWVACYVNSDLPVCGKIADSDLRLAFAREVAADWLQEWSRRNSAVPIRDMLPSASINLPENLPVVDRDELALERVNGFNDQCLRTLWGNHWVDVLDGAGFNGGWLRTSRGLVSRASDGHLCRSMSERTIEEFLIAKGIDHECEPVYPWHERWNPSGRKRADWQLRDGTFVECFGLLNDAAYSERAESKRALARACGFRLLEVRPTDLAHLEAVFRDWLLAGTGEAGHPAGSSRGTSLSGTATSWSSQLSLPGL